MKKVFILFLSLFLIGCFYESDKIGAVIQNYEENTNNIILTIFRRENTNSLNNITIASYELKKISDLQTPLSMDDVQYIKDITNIFDKNYIIPLDEALKKNEAFKYFDIKVKINSNEIYIKDWNNEEHYLSYSTNDDSWLSKLYGILYYRSMATNIKDQQEIELIKEDWNNYIKTNSF